MHVTAGLKPGKTEHICNTEQNRTEQKVYFHINTLFTNICDRVIIDS